MTSEYTLDPQAKAFLDAIADKPELCAFPVPRARELYAEMVRRISGPPVAVAEATDTTIPGPAGPLPARLYRPEAPAGSPAPVLVYFHGGGWTIGDLDTHDNVCRWLTAKAGCLTVSVDYRMGPEYRFPAAVDDAFAATAWVADNAGDLGADAARLAVGGDSAGANLATAVTHLARDAGGPPIRFQLLIYPSVDMPGDYPSQRELAEGYRLTRTLMNWYRDQYFARPEDRVDPRASPLLAKNFAGLPAAWVMTAGFDPLRDEGKAYADKLAAAGSAVEYVCYGGMIHGCCNMTGILDQARVVLDDAAAALRRGLG